MNKWDLIDYVLRNVPGYITKEHLLEIALNERKKSDLEMTVEESIILVGRNLGANMDVIRVVTKKRITSDTEDAR